MRIVMILIYNCNCIALVLLIYFWGVRCFTGLKMIFFILNVWYLNIFLFCWVFLTQDNMSGNSTGLYFVTSIDRLKKQNILYMLLNLFEKMLSFFYFSDLIGISEKLSYNVALFKTVYYWLIISRKPCK